MRHQFVRDFLFFVVGTIVGMFATYQIVKPSVDSIVARLTACRDKLTGAPTEWERGWKTDRVIATRIHSEILGENVKFEFPKNPYNCDDSRIFDLIQGNGGWAYQGGGHPGAAIYVKFDGVNDRESADVKIKDILPKLDKLMGSL